MAGSGSQPPRQPQAGSPRPVPPTPPRTAATPPLRKPPQVLHISRKDEEPAVPHASLATPEINELAPPPFSPGAGAENDDRFETASLEGLTMADLLGPEGRPGRREPRGGSAPGGGAAARSAATSAPARSVDEFDFDEEAFLAALEENEPVGATGEVVHGVVIGVESDGIYVDIGGKAPGFMPKSEAGLGVITNLKERFPKGLEVDVLVTREQNADGMVTISARALALRHSWEKVKQLEKDGKVVQVKISGFNRGGVTCDLEGLRGFIPRSQLQDGENHEALVGKTLGVAFLEVNPETRKLVLSEKRAATAARFQELEVGQLVEGQVVSVKPYGFFVDLGGVSGLLHQSCVTGGRLRDLREVFDQGDRVRALITELDPGRGRIGLNTALLEAQPGEMLENRATVMEEAADRAERARLALRQREQEAG
jgi:small subunit ribosomal protein S1